MLHRVGNGRRGVSSCVALVAPLGRRQPRLLARHFLGAIHGQELVQALRYFRKKLGKRLTVVWDRLQAHRAKVVKRLVKKHPKDYRMHELPGYAPDLNPEEGCNSVVKESMRNIEASTLDEMRGAARRSFQSLSKNPKALRGFFHHAMLSLN